jgi:hypothetical protein
MQYELIKKQYIKRQSKSLISQIIIKAADDLAWCNDKNANGDVICVVTNCTAPAPAPS